MEEMLNPYAAPTSLLATAPTEVDAFRREHLNHEANIKAIGFLYYFGGSIVALVFLGNLWSLQRDSFVGGAIMTTFLGVLGVGQIVVAWGLRRFKAWARGPAAGIAAVGLLAFPLGTAINAYILYLLLSAKGRAVLSRDYESVVRRTPHIEYQTSMVVKVLLCALIVTLLGVFVVGVFAEMAPRS